MLGHKVDLAAMYFILMWRDYNVLVDQLKAEVKDTVDSYCWVSPVYLSTNRGAQC